MTDRGDSKGNVVMRTLRKVTPTMAPAPLNDDEVLDQAVEYAITNTNQLRKERSEWRHKAESITAEFAAFKADAVEEIRIEKHEHESKVAMLRAKIEALDGQLQNTVDMYEGQLKDTRRELNHYTDLSRELATKCEDLEKMYLHQLRAIRDASNHMAVGMLRNVNDVTNTTNTNMNTLIDAAQHSVNGLVNQVEASAKDMAVFIDDIKRRRSTGQYEPKANPLAEKLQPLAPDAEEALARLVQTYKAKQPDEGDPEDKVEGS